MTFNQLFNQFIEKHGQAHDVIFFELLFAVSKHVKDKNKFVDRRNLELDFNPKKFWKLCDSYFVKQVPLAHLTGHTTFCGLDFIVTKKVLAPRDITEQMTQDFINSHKNTKEETLFDLCCGCGCIGISIKKRLPQFNVVCVDKYWKPFFNTHANGVKHKVRLTIDKKDAIEYLTSHPRVDYLISNPPYINEANFNNTAMYKWEDKKALVAPDNGLYFYKKYFAWLDKHNFKEAWLEIGYDLVDALKTEAKNYPNLIVDFVQGKQYIIVKSK